MSCQYVAEWRPAGSDQATVATLMRPPTVTLPSVIRSVWRTNIFHIRCLPVRSVRQKSQSEAIWLLTP